jgi:hypothetical protein
MGAFDFIVPPLSAPEIEHVLRCGMGDILKQRKSQETGRAAAATLPATDSASTLSDRASEDDPLILASL